MPLRRADPVGGDKVELSRLSTVDRSILRLARITFCTDIPGKVVINEAIEIAKKYSGEQGAAIRQRRAGRHPEEADRQE